MIPTESFVEEKFNEFNSLIFSSSLPPIRIVMTKARTFLGKVTYVGKRSFWGSVIRNEDFTLRISTLYDLSEKEWEDVVIHEMIHYHFALNCIRDTSAHGRKYRQMMESINGKYGRNITVRHHCVQGQEPISARKAEKRVNCLCVSLFVDGKLGITSCTAAMMQMLRRKLPRYYRLQSMTWYESSDVFFNRFPRSRTPKIYRISREELDLHLADAKKIL